MEELCQSPTGWGAIALVNQRVIQINDSIAGSILIYTPSFCADSDFSHAAIAILPFIPASVCPGIEQRKAYLPDFKGTNTHSAFAPGLSSNS